MLIGSYRSVGARPYDTDKGSDEDTFICKCYRHRPPSRDFMQVIEVYRLEILDTKNAYGPSTKPPCRRSDGQDEKTFEQHLAETSQPTQGLFPTDGLKFARLYWHYF